MGQVRWTDEAVHWLREIRNYIARDNPEAARRTVRGIYDLGASLDQFPERGYRHSGREGRDVRVVPYGHYRIAYLVKPGATSTSSAFSTVLSTSIATSSSCSTRGLPLVVGASPLLPSCDYCPESP